MTGPLGDAVPGLAEEETKNVKGSGLGYQRRDPAIQTTVQVRTHLLFSFLCVLGCIRKFVYLVFICYVRASSRVFGKVDLIRSNIKSITFELGTHVSVNRFDWKKYLSVQFYTVPS